LRRPPLVLGLMVRANAFISLCLRWTSTFSVRDRAAYAPGLHQRACRHAWQQLHCRQTSFSLFSRPSSAAPRDPCAHCSHYARLAAVVPLRTLLSCCTGASSGSVLRWFVCCPSHTCAVLLMCHLILFAFSCCSSLVVSLASVYGLFVHYVPVVVRTACLRVHYVRLFVIFARGLFSFLLRPQFTYTAPTLSLHTPATTCSGLWMTSSHHTTHSHGWMFSLPAGGATSSGVRSAVLTWQHITAMFAQTTRYCALLFLTGSTPLRTRDSAVNIIGCSVKHSLHAHIFWLYLRWTAFRTRFAAHALALPPRVSYAAWFRRAAFAASAPQRILLAENFPAAHREKAGPLQYWTPTTITENCSIWHLVERTVGQQPGYSCAGCGPPFSTGWCAYIATPYLPAYHYHA